LAANEPILFEKIRLLSLMEMTFRREAKDRQLSFADIAKETELPVDQVEILVGGRQSPGGSKWRGRKLCTYLHPLCAVGSFLKGGLEENRALVIIFYRRHKTPFNDFLGSKLLKYMHRPTLS
jgi:hypothetical protein